MDRDRYVFGSLVLRGLALGAPGGSLYGAFMGACIGLDDMNEGPWGAGGYGGVLLLLGWGVLVGAIFGTFLGALGGIIAWLALGAVPPLAVAPLIVVALLAVTAFLTRGEPMAFVVTLPALVIAGVALHVGVHGALRSADQQLGGASA